MPRQRVLLEDSDETVAKKLKAEPGSWFVIALGPKDRRGSIATVGSRINTGTHRAFPHDDEGWYETTVRSNVKRWKQTAPVEMHGRWRSRTFENPGPDR
jgi:hypothetical protein